MRMLAGVLPPHAGTILLDGIDVVAEPERAKPHLSYMPQRFGLYEDLTVAENIRFYAELFAVPRKRPRRTGRGAAGGGRAPALPPPPRRQPLGRDEAEARARSARSSIRRACCCSMSPPPASIRSRAAISGRILYDLREEGVTIVLSTAYMDEAERCTRLALLHAGEIRRCDTPARLKQAMPGALLAVPAPDPRAVRAALAGAEGVLGLLLMGDRVHVRVENAERACRSFLRGSPSTASRTAGSSASSPASRMSSSPW